MNGGPSESTKAIQTILDRVLGRPVQPTEDVTFKVPETIEDWDKLASLLRHEDDVD